MSGPRFGRRFLTRTSACSGCSHSIRNSTRPGTRNNRRSCYRNGKRSGACTGSSNGIRFGDCNGAPSSIYNRSTNSGRFCSCTNPRLCADRPLSGTSRIRSTKACMEIRRPSSRSTNPSPSISGRSIAIGSQSVHPASAVKSDLDALRRPPRDPARLAVLSLTRARRARYTPRQMEPGARPSLT